MNGGYGRDSREMREGRGKAQGGCGGRTDGILMDGRLWIEDDNESTNTKYMLTSASIKICLISKVTRKITLDESIPTTYLLVVYALDHHL